MEMAGYVPNNRPFSDVAPSPSELAEVLQIQQQHWKPVAREMHQRWPDIWPAPQEIDGAGFYESLVVSFKNHPEGTREILHQVARSKGSDKKRLDNWRRLLNLPIGAFSNGQRVLRTVDPDRFDEIDAVLRERSLLESCQALTDALDAVGKPAFGHVMSWLMPLYPELMQHAATEDGTSTAAQQFEGETLSTPEQDWDATLAKLQDTLERTRAEPFGMEALELMAAALDELRSLAEAHQDSLALQRRDGIERASVALAAVRGALADPTASLEELFITAEQRLTRPCETFEPSEMASLADVLERQVVLALDARERVSKAKQALMDAVAGDRDTEIPALVEEKRSTQSALIGAETAIADALRRFANEPEGESTLGASKPAPAQLTETKPHGAGESAPDTTADNPTSPRNKPDSEPLTATAGDHDGAEPQDLEGTPEDPAAISAHAGLETKVAAVLAEGEAKHDVPNGDAPPPRASEQTTSTSESQVPGAPDVPIQPAQPAQQHSSEPTDKGVSADAPFVFESFCENRWIGPDGRCQRAPWISDNFDERLRSASLSALEQKRFAHLEVCSRALESREQMPLIAADDVRAIAEICTQPESDSAGGADAPRLPRLLDVAQRGFAARAQILVGAVLEALKPSDDAPPTDVDRQAILDAAAIGSPDLRILMERLLTFRQHGEDGWGKLLQRYSGGEALSDAIVSEQLLAARELFQLRVQQLWSAAAGKIQRTHCRKAWTEFVETHVSQLAPVLSPGEQPDDFTRWDIGKLTNQIRKLTIRHTKIADHAEARHADRRMMDKAVAEIAALAANVLRLAQLHSKRATPRHFQGIELPLPELRTLVTGEPLADAAEELCRLSIVALVSRQPVMTVSGITEADRWQFPGLLPMLDRDDDLAARRWAPILPISAINPSTMVAAAALLLHADDQTPIMGDMPKALRSRLIETGRSDLLPYLVGSDEFAGDEKTRIQRELSDRIEALNQRLRVLEGLRRDVTALALPHATDVDRAYESARDLLEDRERVHRELPLIASWLDALISTLGDERNRNLGRLRTEAERLDDADQRAGVLAEINEGRFDRALEGLRDKSALARSDGDAIRQTLWRREARLRFSDPLSVLQAATQHADLGDLPKLWLNQRRGDDKQNASKLRRAFYDFVSGEGDLSATRKRRLVPKELREFRNSQIVINCAELLRLLAEEGLNPSFVPQLRDFSALIIASPPFGITPTNAPNQLSRYVSAERDSRKLVLFLMPGLAEPARERILAELRGRELRSAGAVLDDLDLCRLMGQDAAQRPYGMLGLIELAFEQLSWKDLSPYVSRDGQFIQLEMFVGREREAEKLALTAEYTRIFSGRKLGKSALLKYVEQTYSGNRLPSGNELRVLYIIVAGGESENWLTDKVVAEIRARFPAAPDIPDETDPGARMAKFLEAFFLQHPKVSLLVILDEADTFVEGQLKEYDRVRERCLSFRMMKETFGGVDQNNLPRVRFVFSGYRVTNSRAGAWANAGSILRLSPLSEDDSIKLAAGPLARLGIDANAQAATIARYCGFQPAIIIRFCDSLLKHVHLSYAASGRREVTITYEDVVNTFHQASVQEEIRTINDNNFQGNRVGRILFWTMLLAFNDLLSGQGLENAPAKLLERIRSVDADTGWLRKLDPSETGEILRNLHDFRDRALIEEKVQQSGPVYHMKFPAHLPVLMTEEDPEHQIRQDIQRVRDGGHEAHFVTSLLTPKQIDDLHFALSEDGANIGISIAVAASPWLGALQDDRGGVVDRLGYRGEDIADENSLSALPHNRRPLLIHDATAEFADLLVRERDKSLTPPLVIGGIDLMRWALQQSLNDAGVMVSYVGLKRLDEARLTWWYERLRNIHFDTQDAIARIMGLTSGVPMLLSIWESLMPPQAEIGRDRFDEVCDKFNRRLPGLVELLSSNDTAIALSKREHELLHMAALVGQGSNGAFHLRDELADSWVTWASLLGDSVADVQPLYAVEGDEVAINLLIENGYIPVNGRGEVLFQPDDAIYRLFVGDA